jgi:hypothetical protein
MTAQTPVYGIKYPEIGEPIRTTRQILQDNATAIEAALLAGPASPPNASDLATVAGRVTMLEGITGTETAIKAAAGPHAAGRQAWATDTKARGIFDGTRWLFYDTAWQTFTPAIYIGNGTGAWTQGNGTALGRYFRKGREVAVAAEIVTGSSSNFNAAAGQVVLSLPTGLAPASWMTTVTAQPSGTAWVSNGAAAFGFAGIQQHATPAQRRVGFWNTAGVAMTSAAGTAGSWNLWAAGQSLRFALSYETGFEA